MPQPSLPKEMMCLLESGQFADVTFVIGDAKIRGHRCILASRSNFFTNMFTVGMRESEESVITV